MQDFKDGLPVGNVSLLQNMSLGDFRQRFSTAVQVPEHFSGYKMTHFTTNEYDYSSKLNEITTRGGLHLAVMGGLDPVLGQVAIARPDLSIVMDINDQAINWITDGRLLPLNTSSEGNQYWDQVANFHSTVIAEMFPDRYDFPTTQDMRLGGWSAEKHFDEVKKAWQDGKVKIVRADIMGGGLELGINIARETGIPIRLIYLSNILDYKDVSKKLPLFKKRLKEEIEHKNVDPNAQVIIVGDEKGINTHILSIAEFLQS